MNWCIVGQHGVDCIACGENSTLGCIEDRTDQSQGMVHKDDGRLAEAVDCLQAASMLEESDRVENFRSIL
ncbi:hypothetical protein V6N13_127408 [Hibiscus sabdariffa]